MIFRKHLKGFLKILEPESWIFVFFILTTLNIGNFKPYLLVVTILLVTLYIANKNLTSSVWLAFVMTYLMRKEKYFVKLFSIPEKFIELGMSQPEIVYFISFSDAFLILLLFLLMRNTYLHKSKNYINLKIKFFPDYIFLLIIVLGSISSHLSFMSDFSWFWLFQITKLFLMFYLTRIFAKTKNMNKKTLEIIFIYVLFSSLLVIFQKFNGGYIGFAAEEKFSRFADESLSLYRPGGFFWDSNLIASILAMLIPSWLILSFSKKFNKIFIWSCITIGILALIFSASRAAWIITIFLSFLAFYLVPKNKYKFPKILKKNWGPILIAGLIIFGKTIVDRLLSLSLVFKQNGGAIYRLRHIQIALELLYNYPLGVGVNVFQYIILRKFDPKYFFLDSTPAHNLFAQIGSGFGFIGIILFSWIFIKILNDKFQSTSHSSFFIKYSLLLATLGYLLTTQFYPWFYKTPINGIFWILLGLLYA